MYPNIYVGNNEKISTTTKNHQLVCIVSQASRLNRNVCSSFPKPHIYNWQSKSNNTISSEANVHAEPTPLDWTLEEDWKTQADGDGGREGPLKSLRCRSDIDHWQATSKGPGYEHDSQPTFGPLNPTAHFYREFTAYLDNPFFISLGDFHFVFSSFFFFYCTCPML